MHRTELWRVDRRAAQGLDGTLLQTASALGVVTGDVLVSRVEDIAALDVVKREIAEADSVLRRDAAIEDVFQSSFANGLLRHAGAESSQHLQLRSFPLLGVPVLQLAAYPRPPIADGTRLWSEASVVWLFVPLGADGDRVVAALDRVRPLWERLRAHHDVPLQRAAPAELRALYPVPHEDMAPLDDDQLRRLRDAVHLLTRGLLEADLTRPSSSVSGDVSGVLIARDVLQRHVERLSVVIDHSHGTAQMKLEVLESAARAEFPDDEDALVHLVAPHRHLVHGLIETRQNLERIAADASVSASLITSAAVSRLLDRSTANRVSGTAVAAAAFFAVVLSSFTALAAVPPRSGRAFGDLVRLAGWVGAAGVVVVALSVALAAATARPASAWPRVLRRVARPLVALLVLGALGLFVAAALGGGATLVVLGAVLLIAALFLGALANDF